MIDDTTSAQAYYDLAGLQKLRHLNRNRSPEALREVAAEFESMFLRLMLQSMRDTGIGDPLFDNDASLLYRDMSDQQLSVSLARQGGLGLADLLVRQMDGTLKGITPRPDMRSSLRNDGSLAASGNTAPIDRTTGTTQQDTSAMRDVEPPAQPTMPMPAYPLEQQATEPAAIAASPSHRAAYLETVMSAVPRGKPLPAATESAEAHVADGAELSAPHAFVKSLWPEAQKAASALGVAPEVLIAQAALETGWGKAIVRDGNGRSSNNLFNIKADTEWAGERVAVTTVEYRDGVAVRERAAFRSYDSIAASFDDYVNLISSHPRYRAALAHAHDSGRYVQELQAAGYATDPMYGEKIGRILRGEQFEGQMSSLKDPNRGTLNTIGS